MTKTFIKGALLAAVAFAASPALAANPEPFTAKAIIVKPLTIAKVTDLDFGTTTMNPTLTTAYVTVDKSSGSAAVCSDTTMLGCSGGNEASFTVTGVGTQTVGLTYSALTSLSDGAGHTVAFLLDAPGSVALTNGAGTFYVGGKITVDAATTADGTYTGTVNVTASYN